MGNPRFLALLTVLFWSFSSALARAFTFSSPYLLFCLSFMFALPVYVLYAKKVYGSDFFEKIKKIPFKYFLIGLLGYYAIWVGNTESFLAYQTASETTVLNYTWLIFTVLFTQLFFQRKKALTTDTLTSNLGILLCFVSVYILAVEGNVASFDLSNTKGLLWGLGGGMAYGLFSAYSSVVPEKKLPAFLIAAIISSLIAMTGTAYFRSDGLLNELYGLSLSDWLLAAAMGLLVDAMGYIMWTRSLQMARIKKVSISKIASLIFILPILSLIIVSVIYNEYKIFRLYFLLSFLLLMTGILLAQNPFRFKDYFHRIN